MESSPPSQQPKFLPSGSGSRPARTELGALRQVLGLLLCYRGEEVILLVSAADRIILDCNPVAESFLGRSRAELINRNTRSLYASEDRYRQFRRRAERAYRGEGLYKGTLWLRRVDGSEFPVMAVLIPFSGGEEILLLCIIWEETQDEETAKDERTQLAARLDCISAELGAFARGLREEGEEGERVHYLSSLQCSRREIEIALLVIEGRSSKYIARELGLAESTVKNHLSSLYRKLGISGRLELVWLLAKGSLIPA